MANSRKNAKKPAAVAQMPAPATAAAVEDIPQEFQEPPVAEAQPVIPPPKSPLKKKAPVLPSDGDFFARVAAVPQSDWDSQRVYLYLYVLEPLCNLKQQGGKAYFNRYSAPIRDEHQIAVECGSGRYRLMLAYNRVSAEDSSEMARYEFEVYNPQYPPKVPRAAWINDPRNAKWEALLPKEAPVTAAGSVVEAMRMVSDIRRDLREEMGEPESQSATTNEVLQTMKAAKELFGATAATATATAPAKDPLEVATSLFTLMNQMKAENPVIDMYRDQLKSMQEEMREMRKAPTNQPKTVLEQITDLAALGDKLDPIKKIFGWGNGDSAPSRRTTGLDLARELGGKLFEGPVGEGLGQLLGSFATRNVNGNGHVNPAEQNGNVTPAQSLQEFIRDVINPAILRQYASGWSGSDFAGWLFDAFPDRVKQLQNFAHPMFPGQRGAPAIIAAYKRTPTHWPTLSSRGEDAFTQFVQEFCAWTPESEQEGVLDVEGRTVESEEEEERPERI